MTRERFLGALIGLGALPFAGCAEPTAPDLAQASSGDGLPGGPGAPGLSKTEAQWRALLSPAEFNVLFQEGTELAGSSPLSNEHGDGIYVCVACLVPLFRAVAKYDSKTGWPSFWTPVEDRLGFKQDLSLGVPRTEYHCVRCAGHQGHVFDDGPRPTGKRYCNNGVALRFVPTGEALPDLRT